MVVDFYRGYYCMLLLYIMSIIKLKVIDIVIFGINLVCVCFFIGGCELYCFRKEFKCFVCFFFKLILWIEFFKFVIKVKNLNKILMWCYF